MFKHCRKYTSYTSWNQVHNTKVKFACTPNKAMCTPNEIYNTRVIFACTPNKAMCKLNE